MTLMAPLLSWILNLGLFFSCISGHKANSSAKNLTTDNSRDCFTSITDIYRELCIGKLEDCASEPKVYCNGSTILFKQVLLRRKDLTNASDFRFRCKDEINRKSNTTTTVKVLIVSSCVGAINETLQKMCDDDRTEELLNGQVMVNISGPVILYGNKYCALCSGNDFYITDILETHHFSNEQMTIATSPSKQNLIQYEFHSHSGNYQHVTATLLLFPELPLKPEVNNTCVLVQSILNYAKTRAGDAGMELMTSDIYGVEGNPGAVKYIRISGVVGTNQNISFTKLQLLQNKLLQSWNFKYTSDHVLTPSLIYPEWRDPSASVLFHARCGSDNASLNVFTLSPSMDCPLKSFEYSEYTRNKSGFVQLMKHNQIISPGKYFVTGGVLFTCVQGHSEDIHITQNTPLLIFSLFTFIFSMIFLAVTLLTYFLFKELRTLPGVNIMFLCATQLVAQISFFTSLFSENGSLYCIATGIFNHFIWLSEFCWMTVCAFHVYKIFRTIAPTTGTESIKYTILKNTLFAYGCPLGVTTLTVILSSMTGDLAYGSRLYICTVEGITPAVIALFLPICLSVVINVCFLVLTARAFKQATESRKKIGQKSLKIVSYILKLSTITSLVWVLWIISKIWPGKFIKYFVIGLCQGQGLLIFLAFIANKKVFKLYKMRFNSSQ